MAKLPQSVELDLSTPGLQEALKQATSAGYTVGYAEGLQKGAQLAIDFLQDAYIEDEGRPDRGSPKAEAILELAKSLSTHLREKLRKAQAEAEKRVKKS